MSAAMRTRWAAVGAAVAISLGVGGIGISHAVIDSGVKNVFVPLDAPCRLVDTRPGSDNVGTRSTPLPAGTAVTFDAFGTNGNCTLPTGFSGLALNVTPVNASANTDIRLYPTGGTVPLTSNLNPEAGTLPVPNAVDVGVSTAGEFDVLNKFGTVDIVIDVAGYYDDHHHDDRYPTFDEVVGAPGGVELFAAATVGVTDVVESVGPLTSVTARGTGWYRVVFGEDAFVDGQTTAFISLASNSSIDVPTPCFYEIVDARTLDVRCYDLGSGGDESPEDAEWSLMIYTTT